MSESKWLWLFLILEYLRACCITYCSRRSAFGFRVSAYYILHTIEFLYVVFHFLFRLDHMSLSISLLFFLHFFCLLQKDEAVILGTSRGWVGLIHNSPCITTMFRQIRCSFFLRQFIFIFNLPLLFFPFICIL